MILIVKGRDVHTVRLEQSLQSLDKQYKLITKPEELDNTRYELAFVDPSFNYDISSNLKADKIVFYDCEDSPTDFYPGAAWNTIKADTYVKMNYSEDDPLKIHKVAFPLPVYKYLQLLAGGFFNVGSKAPEDHFLPTFIGSPTYIGNYPTPEKVKHKNKPELKVLSDNGMYNQRYDWINSLAEDYTNRAGLGIVFREGTNLSRGYQKQHFGNVELLESEPIKHQDLVLATAFNRIGLSPTGHERLSWRIWDIMAAGAILFVTDFGPQRSFYMPEEYIIVKDEEDIGTIISSLSINDLKDLHKAAKKNQEFMASLRPEAIWDDFINRIK